MNLKSCEYCGVVVDLDHVKINEPKYDDDFCIVAGTALWDSDESYYVKSFKCPVCGINNSTGEKA